MPKGILANSLNSLERLGKNENSFPAPGKLYAFDWDLLWTVLFVLDGIIIGPLPLLFALSMI